MADGVIASLATRKPASPDRDAILLAAGRASVRRAPAWKLLVAGLAVQHALLLGLWFSPGKSDRRDEIRPMKEIEDRQPAAEDIRPESPSVPFDRSASLFDLDPPPTVPVPTASVVSERHWTARTDPSELSLD